MKQVKKTAPEYTITNTGAAPRIFYDVNNKSVTINPNQSATLMMQDKAAEWVRESVSLGDTLTIKGISYDVDRNELDGGDKSGVEADGDEDAEVTHGHEIQEEQKDAPEPPKEKSERAKQAEALISEEQFVTYPEWKKNAQEFIGPSASNMSKKVQLLEALNKIAQE